MPLVLYIPPPVPDFVFMKREHLKCPVQAQQLPPRPRHSFRSSTKGGECFLPFFLLTGLCALLCFNTTPDPPIHFGSLSLGAGEEAAAFVCSWTGGAALQLLLSTWSGSSATLGAQAEPDNRATAQLANTDKLPDTNPLACTKRPQPIRPSPATLRETAKAGKPPAIFKSHNNVWLIELHFVNSCQHRTALHTLDLVLIWGWHFCNETIECVHIHACFLSSASVDGDRSTQFEIRDQHLVKGQFHLIMKILWSFNYPHDVSQTLSHTEN